MVVVEVSVARKYFWTAPVERKLECLRCEMFLVIEVDCDDNIVGRCCSCGYREMILPPVVRRTPER